MILDNNTEINGIAYDWASITLKWVAGTTGVGDQITGVDGATLIGVSKIAYGETRDFQHNYGYGSYPISKGQGNITVEASMTINMQEYLKLLAFATNGKIQNLGYFDVQVSYAPGTGDTPTQTHLIQSCSLSSSFFEVSQNDMNMEVEVDLHPLNIKYN
jgi:hypothetical protein